MYIYKTKGILTIKIWYNRYTVASLIIFINVMSLKGQHIHCSHVRTVNSALISVEGLTRAPVYSKSQLNNELMWNIRGHCTLYRAQGTPHAFIVMVYSMHDNNSGSIARKV